MDLRERYSLAMGDNMRSIPRYQFCKIPNNEEGKELIRLMRKFLNKDRYTLRARGQFLDPAKLESGESWRNFVAGQPINKSKYLRVYIDG